MAKNPILAARAGFSSLEQWASSTFSHDKTADTQSTINLSQFGLKTPEDVITFLQSPAGKSLEAEFDSEVANERFMQQYQQMETQQHEILRHRLRAVLFLAFLEEKSQAAKIQEIVIAQNEIAIQSSGKPILPKKSPQDTLNDAIDDYDLAIAAAKKRQEEITKEREVLELQKRELEQEEHLLQSKYDYYNTALSAVDTFLELWEHAAEMLSIQAIENQIKQITAEIEVQSNAHQESFNSSDVKTASRIIIQKITALNFQLNSYQDMLEVRNNKKYCVDDEGKPVASYKEAAYILDAKETLVKEGDLHYLLKPGQNWEVVKDNPEAKAKAQQNFEQKWSSITPIKDMVHHTQKHEASAHAQRMIESRSALTRNKAEEREIRNQITLLEAAKASAEQTLNQLELKPTPKPTTASSATASKPKLDLSTHYRAAINKLKKSHEPSLTFPELKACVATAPDHIKTPAMAYLNSESTKTLLKNIPRTAPIPAITMNTLLIRLAAFGVNPIKPGIAPEKDQESPEASPSITPFKTTPTPHNNN